MLYSEFLRGTKADENSQTYEQFLAIEKIYMDCEHMSKEQAYRLWKNTYGKEMKLQKKMAKERLEKLAMPIEKFNELPECDRNALVHELDNLYWKAYFNEDGSVNRIAENGRCFTDAFGIVWFIKVKGGIYSGRYRNALFAYFEGKVVDAMYEA